MACTRMFYKRLVSPLFYTAPCNHFGTETHTVTHIGLGLLDSSFRTPDRIWTCDLMLLLNQTCGFRRRHLLYPKLSYGCIRPVLLHLLHLCGTSQSFQLCLKSLVPASGFGPLKPYGEGFTVPCIWPLYKTGISKTFVGLREFLLSQWATTFALQGYLLLRFKCGPHCHTK